MSDDDYTFEKLLTNLQGIADQMTETAMKPPFSTTPGEIRVVAAALDATIENLLWLIRNASISWAATRSTGPDPTCPQCLGTGFLSANDYVRLTDEATP